MRLIGGALFALVFACVGACSDEDAPTDGWRPAFDADALGWFWSGWAAPNGDRYAVGGVPSEGLVMREHDGVWAPVNLGVAVPMLIWMHGVADDDAFVVGRGGTILHLDGAAWTAQSSGTTQELWGVWCATRDDCWAVGGNGMVEGDATILRYDGSAWRVIPTPALGRDRVFAFYKVWGASANDVYLVGQRGALLHWDGAAFSVIDLGATDDLVSIWGSDATHVVAVGGRGNGRVAAWDGVMWRTRSLTPLPGMNGVWMGSPERAHIVGNEGAIGVLDFRTLDIVDQSQDTRLVLHGVFGGADGELTAVGGNLFATSAPYRGIALERRLGAGE